MVTFTIGLVILIVGGALYSKLCEHVFGPMTVRLRPTPSRTALTTFPCAAGRTASSTF